MNPATRAAARLALSRGHTVLGYAFLRPVLASSFALSLSLSVCGNAPAVHLVCMCTQSLRASSFSLSLHVAMRPLCM
jgi:hypothetical protein